MFFVLLLILINNLGALGLTHLTHSFAGMFEGAEILSEFNVFKKTLFALGLILGITCRSLFIIVFKSLLYVQVNIHESKKSIVQTTLYRTISIEYV